MAQHAHGGNAAYADCCTERVRHLLASMRAVREELSSQRARRSAKRRRCGRAAEQPGAQVRRVRRERGREQLAQERRGRGVAAEALVQLVEQRDAVGCARSVPMQAPCAAHGVSCVAPSASLSADISHAPGT